MKLQRMTWLAIALLLATAFALRAYDPSIGDESFERGFPSTYWFAGDMNAGNGADYWGLSSVRGALWSGNSVWCAQNGSHTPGIYDNYMTAYMYVDCLYQGRWRDYSSLLYCYVWDAAPGGSDTLKIVADGYVYHPAGGLLLNEPFTTYERELTPAGASAGTWNYIIVDLPPEFDRCRYVRVWWIFESDGTGGNEGCYVDEINFNWSADCELYPMAGGFSGGGIPSPATSARYQTAQIWSGDSLSTTGLFNFSGGDWVPGCVASGGFGGTYALPLDMRFWADWYGIVVHDLMTGRYEEVTYFYKVANW